MVQFSGDVCTGSDKSKPCFHVMPPEGWVNDPNGPIYYKGYYHLFYQYVETGCDWSFGLLWGHAISRDLVWWEHLPPALSPTYGGFDGDGCFSGCTTLDCDGTPVMLYTGVRLRTSEVCGPLPPKECDLGTDVIETQCMAVGDKDDPLLVNWTKLDTPIIALPPPDMNLTAWRDPFVISRPDEDENQDWTIMLGAGYHDIAGAALVYKAKSLHGPWHYHGELCRGKGNTGTVWECPLMLRPCHLPPKAINCAKQLQPVARRPTINITASAFSSPVTSPRQDGCGQRYIPSFASPRFKSKIQLLRQPSHPHYPEPVSPHKEGRDPSNLVDKLGHSLPGRYQTLFAVCPDNCNSMSVYWLGHYCAESTTFDLDDALGPYPFDLGDIFYAPNTCVDPLGRCLLWGWLQERPRKCGTYSYAGCLSLTRVLYLDSSADTSDDGSGIFLHQSPPEEMVDLRVPGREWISDSEGLILEADATLPIPKVDGPYLEFHVVMERGCSSSSSASSSISNGNGHGMPGRVKGENDIIAGHSNTPEGVSCSAAAEKADDSGAVAEGDKHGSSKGTANSGVTATAEHPKAPVDKRGPATSSGLLLQSWQAGSEGRASLLYHWDDHVLEVVFEAVDPETMTFHLGTPTARRVGGKLLRPPAAGQPLELRVFLDYSVLEVFTAQGEALTVRIYRGVGEGSGVELVSFGGATTFTHAAAYEVGSIWDEERGRHVLKGEPAHAAGGEGAVSALSMMMGYTTEPEPVAV